MKRRRPALPKPTKNRGFCDFSFSPAPDGEGDTEGEVEPLLTVRRGRGRLSRCSIRCIKKDLREHPNKKGLLLNKKRGHWGKPQKD